MKIQSISATADTIRLTLDEPLAEPADLSVYNPLYGTETDPLITLPMPAGQATLSLPRDAAGRDGICLRYVLTAGGQTVPGKRYVESITDAPRNILFAHHLSAYIMPRSRSLSCQFHALRIVSSIVACAFQPRILLARDGSPHTFSMSPARRSTT